MINTKSDLFSFSSLFRKFSFSQHLSPTFHISTIMTSFLSAISCGIIGSKNSGSHHGSSEKRHTAHPTTYDDKEHSASNNQQESPTTSELNHSGPSVDDPGSKRSSKRLSGGLKNSRLSWGHRKPKTRAPSQTKSKEHNRPFHPRHQSVFGTTGEDFRIRDEDIAISSHRPSFACSMDSNLIKPHTVITNTSSVFQDYGSIVPAMPDLHSALASSTILPDMLAVPVLADMPQPKKRIESADEEAVADLKHHGTSTPPVTTTLSTKGNPSSEPVVLIPTASEKPSVLAPTIPVAPPVTAANSNSEKSIDMDNIHQLHQRDQDQSPGDEEKPFATAAAPGGFDLPSSMLDVTPTSSKLGYPRPQTDRIMNRALIIDTSLDRNFGF